MGQEPRITRQRRHQLKRREEGLCGVEGCPVVTGPHSFYCAEHKRQRREAARRRTRESRAAKLAAVTG